MFSKKDDRLRMAVSEAESKLGVLSVKIHQIEKAKEEQNSSLEDYKTANEIELESINSYISSLKERTDALESRYIILEKQVELMIRLLCSLGSFHPQGETNIFPFDELSKRIAKLEVRKDLE